MSHKAVSETNCPNCGFQVSHNYCAQCGQPTHLHKEHFIGMILHFIAHYFHYDSKFWQTIKTLLFKPGKLTIAYWQNQRMRYLPPISLYIFISAVHFLVTALVSSGPVRIAVPTETPAGLDTVLKKADVADSFPFSNGNYVNRQMEKLKKKHGDVWVYLRDSYTHNYPKLFFFMIPFMAFVLQLLYFRRKQIYFVDHSVFSLHYHSFWFAIFTLDELTPAGGWWSLTTIILRIVALAYLCVALHRVYQSSRLRSVFFGLLIALSYVTFMGLAYGAYFFIILAMA